MEKYFLFNNRLGIQLPTIQTNWESIDVTTQNAILMHWEKIRGTIPDRIADIEKMINDKQAELSNEQNFKRSCDLNSEIAELASIINDLWLWYRTQQEIAEEGKLHG